MSQDLVLDFLSNSLTSTKLRDLNSPKHEEHTSIEISA